MAIERTLSIIKPDAVKKGYIGKILSVFEENNLKICALRMAVLTEQEVRTFYQIHAERAFFESLVLSMMAGPVVISVLEGEDAVKKNRSLMGNTDPKQALPGTIRAMYAESIQINAVHGSDSLKNAQNEIAFFFSNLN